jgi:hypothetical protein
MLFLSIVHHYLLWHYTEAFLELFHVWLNFIWFVIRFFSIPQLMHSWFSPWKRITEKRTRKWDLEDIVGVIIIGLISRMIGFILRTVIIFIGLVCLFTLITGGFLIFTFWVVAPLVIFLLIGLGITLLVV